MGTFLDKSLLLGIFTKNFFAKQLFTKQQNNNFYWIKDDYRHLQADTDANILLFNLKTQRNLQKKFSVFTFRWRFVGEPI